MATPGRLLAPGEPEKAKVPKKEKVSIPSLISEGEKRIRIELEDKSKAEKYVTKWNDLVASVASVVEGSIKNYKGKEREEKFITSVLGALISNVKIKYGQSREDSLFESLDTKEFDCDTSIFLIYDIARKLQINMEMIAVTGHALIKTNNFFFETTTGEYYALAELSKRYPNNLVILNPNQIQYFSYHQRGLLYFKKGKYAEAIDDYNRAIQLCSKHADVYLNRGAANYKKGNHKEAIADFNKAIRLNPTDTYAYNNLAVMYETTGDYVKAIITHTTAIEIEEKSAKGADACIRQATIDDKKGNYYSAITYYSSAIKRIQGNITHYNNRSFAYLRKGDSDKAANDQITVLRLKQKEATLTMLEHLFSIKKEIMLNL